MLVCVCARVRVCTRGGMRRGKPTEEPSRCPGGSPAAAEPRALPALAACGSRPRHGRGPSAGLTVATAGQRSCRCRSSDTMLCCTCVFRLLGSLPAIAATRSPNSAMAAARIPSLSCKAEAQGHSPARPGVPAAPTWDPTPTWGCAWLPRPDAFSPARAPRAGLWHPPQTGHLGRVPVILKDPNPCSLTPTAQVSRA